MRKRAIIIGAGPAGLSAGYELLKTTDILPVIIEECDIPGGISKTVFYNGNGIDIGGHRFFTKNTEILNLWEELLPLQGKLLSEDMFLYENIKLSKNGPDPNKTDNVMLKRKRISRIYYLKKFFDYPISISFNTILNLGIFKTLQSGFSYLYSSIIKRKEDSLEDFMITNYFLKITQRKFGVCIRAKYQRNGASKEFGDYLLKKRF